MLKIKDDSKLTTIMAGSMHAAIPQKFHRMPIFVSYVKEHSSYLQLLQLEVTVYTATRLVPSQQPALLSDSYFQQ